MPAAFELPVSTSVLLSLLGGVAWRADPVSLVTLSVGEGIWALLGYTPGQWLSGNGFWESRLHPDDRERVLRQMADATAPGRLSGRPSRLEYRLYAASGEVVWLRDVVLPLVEDGLLVGLCGVMVDVTADRAAERDARVTEGRFRALVQNSTDLLAVLDASGAYRYLSPAAWRVLGVRPEALVGEPFVARLHPEDAPGVQADLARVLQQPALVLLLRYRLRRADLAWRWMETTLSSGLDDPAVQGLVCTSRDVTGEREAAVRLARSEGRFRALVQSASDLTLLVDCSGVVQYGSPAVARTLGVTPEDLIGRHLFQVVIEEDQPELELAFGRAIGGGAGHVERPLFRACAEDGTLRTMEAHVTNLLEDAQVGALVVNARDVTERRLSEQALQDSQARLLSSEKLASLGRLTAGLAHEINTPLAAAMNYLFEGRRLVEEYRASIGQRSVNEDDHRAIAAELGTTLSEASKTCERIGEFIRQMRGHTRDTASGVTDFDALRLAQDTLAMLAHEARLREVTLSLEMPRAPVEVRGEPGRFTQVLTNLVVNALHACERVPRPGVVDVRFVASEGRVDLQVQDNGSGIEPGVLGRIFDPMFTTKDVGKGTGLGLSIIYDIMKGNFGGEVLVDTTPGEGSTFTAVFPLRERSG